MSQGMDSDEMPTEIDFTGAVLGKHLALYRRWKGITAATGTVTVPTLTTRSEVPAAKIVTAVPYHGFYFVSRDRRISPPPEVATRSA